MQLAEPTVRRAYEMHYRDYAQAREWDVPYHIKCWCTASRAFEDHSEADFHRLYEQLRRYWQVFRPATQGTWPEEELRERLLHARRLVHGIPHLSCVDMGHVGAFVKVFEEVGEIKRLRSGPSVMAASKFLHFVKPQVFLIVDRGVMWDTVLAHRWLFTGIVEQCKKLAHSGMLANMNSWDGTPRLDIPTYVATLLWAAELLRDNPHIPHLFEEYVLLHHEGEEVPSNIHDYESAAVEWMLMGLVSLPPEGVTL